MTRVADVDAGCMGVYHRQLRRFGVKLPLQLLALLTVQAIALQPKVDFFRLAMAYSL